MIRRDLLKSLLTGVAALAMGRSAKAAPKSAPVKVLSPGIDVERQRLRVLRCIELDERGSPPGGCMVHVAVRNSKGQETLWAKMFSSPGYRTTMLFDCGGPALTDDDTLTVYTRVGNCMKVPVPHKAEFEEL